MLRWNPRRIIGMIVFLFSSAMLLWSLFPPRLQTKTIPISPADMQLPPPGNIPPSDESQAQSLGSLIETPSAFSTAESPESPTPTVGTPVESVFPEQRRLVTEWPEKIRFGDTSVIRLVLELDGSDVSGSYPPGEEEPSYAGTSELPDMYDTHILVAEARLEMAGMEFRPAGEVSEALVRGQPVQFIWSVRPSAARKFEGTLWLHIRFTSRDGGVVLRKVIAAQAIEIRGVSFLGLSGNLARILGSLGIAAGAVIGLDLFPWLSRLWFREGPAE